MSQLVNDYQNIKLSSNDLIKIIDISQNGQIEPISANSIIEVVFNNGLYNVLINEQLKHENLQGPLLFSSNSELQILQIILCSNILLNKFTRLI